MCFKKKEFDEVQSHEGYVDAIVDNNENEVELLPFPLKIYSDRIEEIQIRDQQMQEKPADVLFDLPNMMVHAHRSIVAAGSPVLAKILEGKIKLQIIVFLNFVNTWYLATLPTT